MLEKVALSLIKGHKTSPCFTVPLTVKMDCTSIKVHALLNSEASTCFIDKDFADHHKLPLITKKHPILIKIIDSRALVSGDVIYETTSLDIIVEGHHSFIAFNVIKSSLSQHRIEYFPTMLQILL
jgi:hypothetical protein